MASYTNTLMGNPKVFIEQNIRENGELMGFDRILRFPDGRERPVMLCYYRMEAQDFHLYKLDVGYREELEERGLTVICPDLPCLDLKTAKARRNGILELIKEDMKGRLGEE